MCGVGGWRGVLDHIAVCLTGQLSHPAQTPASHRLPSEPAARWSESLETGGLTLPRQSAYVQLFWELMQSCESSSLCSPDGAWPVPPLKGVAATDQIAPQCQQLSRCYPGSGFCFRIASVSILLKEGSADYLFIFYIILYCIVLYCIVLHLPSSLSFPMRDKFVLLQKSLFPKAGDFPRHKYSAPENADFSRDGKHHLVASRGLYRHQEKFRLLSSRPSHRVWGCQVLPLVFVSTTLLQRCPWPGWNGVLAT